MRGLSASPLLITTNLAMCVQNLSKVAGFAQVRDSCLVRLVRKQTSLQFSTCTTHALREYTCQQFCRVSACRSRAVRCSVQSPDPSFPLSTFRWSSKHFTGVSACKNAHTRSPVSTQRSYQAACNESPLTHPGDGVGANTSSLTVVATSFKTSFTLTRCAQPVSKMYLPGSTSDSTIQ